MRCQGVLLVLMLGPPDDEQLLHLLLHWLVVFNRVIVRYCVLFNELLLVPPAIGYRLRLRLLSTPAHEIRFLQF